MRKIVSAASLFAILLITASIGIAAPAPTQKAAPGTLVIVFKDGHRQSFSLADIERVEFPTAGSEGAVSASGPSRGRFFGRWEVGDGSGSTFYITLQESGDANRSLGDVHGKWAYVNGEAQITWDDGAEDAITRVGSLYQKFAYKAGKSFSDVPDNVTSARNITPKPI